MFFSYPDYYTIPMAEEGTAPLRITYKIENEADELIDCFTVNSSAAQGAYNNEFNKNW